MVESDPARKVQRLSDIHHGVQHHSVDRDVLTSLHLGLHTDQIIQPLKSKKSFAKMKWIGRAVFILIAAYGIYAFIHRGFWGYMSGKTMFAFFDFSESRVLFIVDYLAVMTLFAVIGNYLSKLLKFRRKTK